MNFALNKMSFLVSREEAKNKAKLLMYQWAYSVLSQMGVDFGDSIPEDGDPDGLTKFQQAKMRKILETNKIFILDNQDESLEIYVENELVGKWDRPHYTLKFDRSKINPKEKYYMEVDVFFGSVFDEEQED